MPLYLQEADIHRVLVPRDVTDCLETAFRHLAAGKADHHPRVRVREGKHILHTLPAIGEGFAGVKTYLTGPGGAKFVTLLFGQASGRLEAIVESDRLGQLRTGCATALAARYLSPGGDHVLGLVGAGTVAWGQLEALQAELPLAQVKVFSRTPESRDEFCRRALEELGVEARPAASVAEAVEGTTLLVTATWAKEPIVEQGMVPPTCLVCAVGSNWPDRREVSEDVVTGADRVVVDDVEAARTEAGDLLLVPELDWTRVETLADLVTSPKTETTGRVLFKSVGLGLEDVATAALALRRARVQGLGQEVG